MDTMIKKMRCDWMVVAEDRKACGEWTADDEKAIGDAVKSAIEGGKPGPITLWARWLADLAATTIALKAIAIGIDLRMREQARKQRDEMKRAA